MSTTTTPEPIEATYTTTPVAGPDVSRADVLRAAQALVAQVTGLAAVVEQAALAPAATMRPAFLTAWRAWAGYVLGEPGRLARAVFKPQEEAAVMTKHGARLAEWRAGIAQEVGALTPPVAEVKPTANEPKPISVNSWRRWPWWVIVPSSIGAAYGTFMATRWMFKTLVDSMHSSGDREQSGEPKPE